MWGYLRLRWWLSETSKNTTPPRAPNGTKKGRCRTKKRPIQKKAIIELHPWKMVWQNCPVSWKFWFPKPQSCSASAFPYFEADAELGVLPEVKSKIWKHLNGKYHFSAYWTISGIASLWGGGGTIFFKAPLIISSGIFFQQTLDLFYIIASIKLSKCFDQ